MTAEIIATKREKPILFNADMVRAILDGRKTQTRRIVKPHGWTIEQMSKYKFADVLNASESSGLSCQQPATSAYAGFQIGSNDTPGYFKCPFGTVGDQLWVRETFFAFGRWEMRYSEKKNRDEWHFVDMTLECGNAYKYDADNPNLTSPPSRIGALTGWYRRPAIFMPRQASRIQLEITNIRVERLQDISEEDAIAEGVKKIILQKPFPRAGETFWEGYENKRKAYRDTAIDSFSSLWNSTGGDWDANPWVWVIEFKRVEVAA